MCQRRRTDLMLTGKIAGIHRRSRDTYGSPNIHAELADDHGIHVGRKRVARLMCAAGLRGATLRKFVVTTTSDPQAQKPVDLVERKFFATAPDQLWVADITYIPTWSGFLYLAMVLDVYSRKIVGWAMDTNLKTPLILEALEMAITQRQPRNVIHHSDRGCQGDFQRSSQHLVNGGVVWDGHQGGLRNGQDGHRCGHQAGRVSTSGRLSKHSGYALLQEIRAKMQHWRAACRSRLVLAGSARPAGWRHSVWARALDGICHSMNAKNSRYCTLRGWRFAGSPGRWAGRLRQFRGSCVATLRREAVSCAIEPRSHSGRPIGWPHDPRPSSLRRTRDCTPTYKIDSPGMSLIYEVSRSWDRMCRRSGAATAAVLIGGGASAGARSRSVADCRSTSRMMPPCGFLTRPSTRHSMFRVEERYDASCQRACARAGHCVCRVPGRDSAVSRSSLRR